MKLVKYTDITKKSPYHQVISVCLDPKNLIFLNQAKQYVSVKKIYHRVSNKNQLLQELVGCIMLHLKLHSHLVDLFRAV